MISGLDDGRKERTGSGLKAYSATAEGDPLEASS